MEYKDEEQYLILNFKDQVDQKFFEKPNLFFKIVNLETKHPLIQIGNHIFKAKVDDDSLGTSLIFEEDDDYQVPNIYEKETQIQLKYLAKTCSFLNLQWYKLPDKVPDINPSELVDLEFQHSYETVLKQLQDGDLDINDIIKKPEGENGNGYDHSSTREKNVSKKAANICNTLSETLELSKIQQEAASNITASEDSTQAEQPEEEEYALLNDLVHRQVNDPQYYDLLKDDVFTNDKEFMILKEIYLKSFDYTKLESKLTKTSIWDYVDLRGSISNGTIEVKEKLDEGDKKKLFSLDNFDNFSLDLKIMVLTDYLREQKNVIRSKSELQLLEEDEFGRTIKKRYKMVKSLVKDLKYNLFTKTVQVSKNCLDN